MARYPASRLTALRSLALALTVAVVIPAASVAAGKPGYPDRVTWSGGSWQVKNLSLFGGAAPSNGLPVEVVVESFTFVP